MTIATKIVDWAALGDVALISLAIGLVVTTTLAIAVRTALAAQDQSAEGHSGPALINRLIAGLSVLAALSVFVLGIYEIAAK
jgi:hypothetical protein